MSNKPLQASWYDYPHYYDIAFQADTNREADFIEAAGKKYCPFKARRLLEPACGTGRLVVELASRGYRLEGFDLSSSMIGFLDDRLKQRDLKAKTYLADMTDFQLARPADLAYCPVNTFRYLLTEEAARKHLECISATLRPGGIYVLSLHLLPPDAAEEDGERWTERQGKTQVTVTLRVLETDRRRRVERLRVNLLVREGKNEMRFRDDFCFRMYTAAQFRRLLASVPSLELCDVYDFWYEIDHPLKLNNENADTVFILRKK